MSLFHNSLGFWNRPVFPSSFGNAGLGFEVGTVVFEGHGVWVLGTKLSSLHHHSLHTASPSMAPLRKVFPPPPSLCVIYMDRNAYGGHRDLMVVEHGANVTEKASLACRYEFHVSVNAPNVFYMFPVNALSSPATLLTYYSHIPWTCLADDV